MSEEKLRNKLWDIVNKEFNDFKNEQLQNSKEEIFENAFKISTLSDFVDMCDPECGCLKIDEVKALIKEKYPAHTLYNFYMKSDAGGISDLYESIWYRLNDLASRNNINKNKDNFEKIESHLLALLLSKHWKVPPTRHFPRIMGKSPIP